MTGAVESASSAGVVRQPVRRMGTAAVSRSSPQSLQNLRMGHSPFQDSDTGFLTITLAVKQYLHESYEINKSVSTADTREQYYLRN